MGNLFAQSRSNFQEQELLVIVTPYLVSPLAGHAVSGVPGSDTFEPSDLEFYLKGAMHGSIPEDYRSPVAAM